MRIRSAILLACLMGFARDAAAQWTPAPGLGRSGLPGSTPLNHFPTSYVAFSWYPAKVRFIVFWRPQPTGAWHDGIFHDETPPFYVTAIAPLYSGKWDSLYVIGVRDDGTTVFEKWRVVIAVEPDATGIKVSVEKSPVLTSAVLTTIRAAAAAPNDKFLIVQRHETQDILRLDLPSGKTTTLLSKAAYPNLEFYDVVNWREHVKQGHVFCIQQGVRNCEIDHPGSIFLWDADLDGVPDKAEELSIPESRSRGYVDGDAWQPDRTLYMFD